MSYTVKGEIHQIGETFTVGANELEKREFVLKTLGDYPQFLKFEQLKEKTRIIENYTEGQAVEVHFDINGREWNDKFFTNLTAWKIDAIS